MEIRLSGICYNSLVNGEGMRRVFFTQGCKHNCKGCFNPETHLLSGGVSNNCDELIEDTLKDSLISGVTFSGGDPFEQPEQCNYMAEAFKKAGLNIWAYTGYKFDYIIKKGNNHMLDFISKIDVLVDGKFEEPLMRKGLRFKGSTNQRVIDVQKSLKTGYVILYKKY